VKEDAIPYFLLLVLRCKATESIIFHEEKKEIYV
jgi:hypothetical protein